MTTLALNEPRKIGDVVDWLGRPHRIVAEQTRDEWWAGVQERRAFGRAHGRRGRAGTYDLETKQFKPSSEPPAECRFCYVVVPVERSRR